MEDIQLFQDAITAITGIAANTNVSPVKDAAMRLKASTMTPTAKYIAAELATGVLTSDEIQREVAGKKLADKYHYVAKAISTGAGASVSVFDTNDKTDVGLKSFDGVTFGEPTAIDGLSIQYATVTPASAGNPTAAESLPSNKAYSNLAGNLPAALQNAVVELRKNGTVVYSRQLKDFFTPATSVPTRFNQDEGFISFSPKLFTSNDKVEIYINSPKGVASATNVLHFLNFTMKGYNFIGLSK